jgi:hypothetical protein
MIRSLVLFTHIVGVITLFVGLVLEWLGLDAMRRSTTRAEALPWIRLNVRLPRVYGIAFGVIVVSGFYLGSQVGVLGDGWMRASYGALLLIAVPGGTMARPGVLAARRALEDSSDRTLAALRSSASGLRVRASLRVRIAIGLALVYLMIGKPDVGQSLAVIGLSLVVAVVGSLQKRPAKSTLVEGYR